jgi:hypothetical protein
VTFSRLLMRPAFWVVFVVVVAVALFLYGLKVVGDETALGRARSDLKAASVTLKQQHDRLTAAEARILLLNDTILDLRSRLDSLIRNDTVVQNDTVIQYDTIVRDKVSIMYDTTTLRDTGFGDKAEPKYPYGKGRGKLTVYLNCSSCGPVTLFVDGVRIGALTRSVAYSEPGLCGGSNSIAPTVLAGNHHVEAKGLGISWEFHIPVEEDRCTVQFLTPERPAEVRPRTQAQIRNLLVGKWRFEISIVMFAADGAKNDTYDYGMVTTSVWAISEDTVTESQISVTSNPTGVRVDEGLTNKIQIVEITSEKLVVRDLRSGRTFRATKLK